MTYLARWPDYFHVAEGPGKRIMGYSMLSDLSILTIVSIFIFLWIRLKFTRIWLGIYFILVTAKKLIGNLTLIIWKQ